MGDPFDKPKPKPTTEYYRGWRPTSGPFLAVTFLFFSLMIVWLGPANILFWFCFVASAGLTAVFCWRLPKGRAGAPILAVVLVAVVPILGMFISVALILNAVLHLILVIRASRLTLPCSSSQVFRKSVCLTLLSFLIAVALGVSPYLDYRKTTQDFSTADVTERVRYMNQIGKDAGTNAITIDDQDLPTLGEDGIQHEVDNTDSIIGRQRALELIHDGTVEMFVKSPGFGVGRILIPDEKRGLLPEIADLPFGKFNVPLNTGYWHSAYGRGIYTSIDGFPELHRASLLDFAHPATYGYEFQPGQFFGFQGHAFHYSPAIGMTPFFPGGVQKLKQLQLISLHRFSEPRAYVLDHLPRMDQLSDDDSPTRVLDEFEIRALQKMQAEKGIVVETESKLTRMVGALPAFDACLECHSASRGELLGAFSYVFERE